MGRDGAGDGDIFLKRRGLIDEDVAAAGEEALVGVHVFARDVGGDGIDERNRVARVADVFVVSGFRIVFGLGDVEREFAAVVKIESALFGVLRRPCIVLAPDVGAGFEYVGGGKFGIGRVFQILAEEGQKDVAVVEVGSF